MTQILTKASQKIQSFLTENNIDTDIKTYPAGTRTAQDAADAIGCDVAQIVKSLIFMTEDTKEPILILTSGANRVNEALFESELGEKLTKADANFVREMTGFAIGGIPPFGHLTQVKTFIDEDLFAYDELWAAAGTPNTVFRVTVQDLDKLTQGKRIRFK